MNCHEHDLGELSLMNSEFTRACVSGQVIRFFLPRRPRSAATACSSRPARSTRTYLPPYAARCCCTRRPRTTRRYARMRGWRVSMWTIPRGSGGVSSRGCARVCATRPTGRRRDRRDDRSGAPDLPRKTKKVSSFGAAGSREFASGYAAAPAATRAAAADAAPRALILPSPSTCHSPSTAATV